MICVSSGLLQSRDDQRRDLRRTVRTAFESAGVPAGHVPLILQERFLDGQLDLESGSDVSEDRLKPCGCIRIAAEDTNNREAIFATSFLPRRAVPKLVSTSPIRSRAVPAPMCVAIKVLDSVARSRSARPSDRWRRPQLATSATARSERPPERPTAPPNEPYRF